MSLVIASLVTPFSYPIRVSQLLMAKFMLDLLLAWISLKLEMPHELKAAYGYSQQCCVHHPEQIVATCGKVRSSTGWCTWLDVMPIGLFLLFCGLVVLCVHRQWESLDIWGVVENKEKKCTCGIDGNLEEGSVCWEPVSTWADSWTPEPTDEIFHVAWWPIF